MAVISRLASVSSFVFAIFGAGVFGAAVEKEFDYVIVGGGVTGLIVANRLSEDKSKTVLVIEGGDNVDIPGNMIPYKANDLTVSAPYKWNFTTQPEPELGNKTFGANVAKVLGGGSVINGMVYDRGAAADYDAWEALGNNGWGWEGMEPYFIKGTTFQPPSPEVAEAFNITWDPAVYGNGPLTVSITDTQYEDSKAYWAAWKATGVHVPVDGNAGEAYGPSWYPNTMDKTTGRRAHARYAYYDPIKDTRKNLQLQLKTTAHEIIFDDSKKPPIAKGVKITDDSGETYTVYAKKEVVLAAGAVQTPKLLQLSGIGPKSVLEAAGIKVRYELDAVGSNFQDHPYGTVIYNTTSHTFPNGNSLATNATYNASAWAEYEANKTGPYTIARGNALAFISLPDMANKTAIDKILSTLTAQNASSFLPSVYKNSPKLLKGFERQREVIAAIFARKDAAVAEFPVPADGTFGLVGIQKPLSRGTIHLNATDPSAQPVITYHAFQNPVDKTILGISLRYFRSVWNRPELKDIVKSETVPGAQFVTDEDIFSALRSKNSIAPTLSHASGSCPMMAEKYGGCVSSRLRVYGTQHLSVVDASIIPIIPSCHLQASVYGIGEKAADIIKAR
ncbi:choline dehydrogenase-like protein [Byssothecium circinans]|uniref:Choline dehydrogenase-like protein n=1 Tax=Byssothecium circinans TaxID=147558 RepID=A0A6A5TJX7_9PLEO|nr:choline dehydrogenase-like protein [Byssothecium circinans]